MHIMGPFRTTFDDSTAATDNAEARFVVVHTDEDEDVVLRGASDAEVAAKLDDFLTWAS